MKIIVNGDSAEVQAVSLDQLLVELDYGAARVATAVNGAFVARDSRANCTLSEGDRLEVVSPRQGG
jgi:sulfur carrier protein